MQGFVLVLFGATGDLARNKLFPALLSQFQKKELPENFQIFAFARRPFSNEEYREFVRTQLQVDASLWNDFSQHVFYQQGMFEEEKGYQELAEKLKSIDDSYTEIFYLATPPENYHPILDNMIATKLVRNSSRIAIEKPFGKDVQTAKTLDQKLSQIFHEDQIFRVDHYLGKETVQNLLIFRFANGIFDPIWNSQYIDHVQITWAEKKGIEGRGKFFDGVGMLRDVGQNHLMQLIAAVAQEMPRSFSEEGVRNVRTQAIQKLTCIEPDQVPTRVVRGQYEGYTTEKNVQPDSSTETFVAMKFFVDSPRFLHVPFYVRVGKELEESVAEIHLVFKQTCHILFKEIGCPEWGNILTIRIQPNQGITIKMIAKTPGNQLSLQPVDMHFMYHEEFGTQGLDAYEKILADILKGDQMLFNRSDELEASWTFIEKILQGWEKNKAPVVSYPKGSWGPKEAQELIEKDGRKWIE